VSHQESCVKLFVALCVGLEVSSLGGGASSVNWAVSPGVVLLQWRQELLVRASKDRADLQTWNTPPSHLHVPDSSQEDLEGVGYTCVCSKCGLCDFVFLTDTEVCLLQIGISYSKPNLAADSIQHSQ
jgi:hypothetical protein